MRILLFGKNGQLGTALVQAFAPFDVVALDRASVDLTDPAALRTAVKTVQPTVVVNAAAYTDVDGAEEHQARAWAVNAEAPGLLAELALQHDFALLHFSTDFVFDGQTKRPYRETDRPHPINAYGASKWAGEQAIADRRAAAIIWRTSWLYSTTHPCFVTKVLQWAKSAPEVRIVDDQIGSPTWATRLAQLAAHLLQNSQPDPLAFFSAYQGVYHAANTGATTRFAWAEAILRTAMPTFVREARLQPTSSNAFPLPAKRPSFSALANTRLVEQLGIPIPPWEADLVRALQTN